MKLTAWISCFSLILAMACPASATTITDNFNSDTSANYSIVSSSADTAVTFAFDYSTLGIPPAPNTTDASTLGLRMAASIAAPTGPEAITLHTNQQFSGDYIDIRRLDERQWSFPRRRRRID
jgi:hypothetical protein